MTKFRIGTAFLGRYVLLGVAGRGGVSVVYKAIDTVRSRLVAIKMLDPLGSDDVVSHMRVRQEAVITDRLRHPSVPRIYDYGSAQVAGVRNIPYVVMELLSGVVLTDRL